MGKGVPLNKLFDESNGRYSEGQEFRNLYNSDPDVKRVVDTGMGIEGLIRGSGVHACAFILSSEKLLNLVPMHKRDKDGMIIAGFAYPQLEEMGLMKMDFLGLRNLGIMDHCVKNIKRNRGEDVDLQKLPLDDAATYELMARGDTLASSSSMVVRCVRCCVRWGPPASTTSSPCSPSTVPVRWVPMPTSSTPTARTVAVRSCRSIPNSRMTWTRSSHPRIT